VDTTEAASQAQEIEQVLSSKKKGRAKRMKQVVDGSEEEQGEERVASNPSTNMAEIMQMSEKVPGEDEEVTDKACAEKEEMGAGGDASMAQNQEAAEMKD
jgi:hypothetical protein